MSIAHALLHQHHHHHVCHVSFSSCAGCFGCRCLNVGRRLFGSQAPPSSPLRVCMMCERRSPVCLGWGASGCGAAACRDAHVFAAQCVAARSQALPGYDMSYTDAWWFAPRWSMVSRCQPTQLLFWFRVFGLRPSTWLSCHRFLCPGGFQMCTDPPTFCLRSNAYGRWWCASRASPRLRLSSACGLGVLCCATKCCGVARVQVFSGRVQWPCCCVCSPFVCSVVAAGPTLVSERSAPRCNVV
jgi:hypothetical protein